MDWSARLQNSLRKKADLRALIRLQAQVALLRDRDAAMADALAAVNAKTQRVATTASGIAIGAFEVTLVWPGEWPDTAYMVIPTLITGPLATGKLAATVKSKTTTDVTLTLVATAVIATAGIDVLGIRT